VENNNRRESNIVRWDTVKVLMSEVTHVLTEQKNSDGQRVQSEVGVSLVINRPVFKDGNEGFPKASLVISRGRSIFRIPFFKGSDDEAYAVINLMETALQLWTNGGHDEYQNLVSDHFDKLKERRNKEIEHHNDMLVHMAVESGRDRSGVGGGLAKFSKESKRDRRKRKRELMQNRRDDE
jgi:hypothetical protein